MAYNLKESQLKSVKLHEVQSEKLYEIATKFQVSNRKALQICLYEQFKVETANLSEYATTPSKPITVFIPINAEQIDALNKVLLVKDCSFADLCKRAIDAQHLVINNNKKGD